MEKDEMALNPTDPQADLTAVRENQTVCGPNTTPYIVEPGDTFFTIARKFGVSLDALIAANPQIPDPSQIQPGQVVCIPNQETVCPPGTFSYIVQPGDTMFSIAQKFGVPLDDLIEANPQIPNPNLIFPGQVVCVPTVTPPPTVCPPGTFSYTVQPGDTMFTIARKFGVSLDALIAANPQIPNPNLIFPGQIVCVPTVTPPPTVCPPGTFAYTVQPGDSMWSIARKFGVSLDALIAANPQIPNPSLIFPGQIVCVPTTPPPPGCPPGTFAYTVQPGDSMWSIARKFGVSLDALIAANPQIPNPSLIFPGQTVCVPRTSPPPSGCPAGTFSYTVKSGDSMWSIAKKFGVSLDALIRANPQIPNPSQIKPGQIVCVPNR